MPHSIATLLLIISIASAAFAQETRLSRRRNTEQLQGPKGWKQYYSQIAADVEILQSGKGSVPSQLEFHDRSFQDYFDPRATDRPTHGSIFIWTKDERPQVVGGVWSTRTDATQRRVNLSLHSLSDAASLEARRGKELIWNPTTPGIQCIKLPATKSRKPHAQASYIRSVVRSLDFLYDTQNTNTPQRTIETQTQPVYRYSNEQVTHGAVYIAFSAWDPELSVLIENRKLGTESGWHIAFARYSEAAIRVLQDGKELWKCDALGQSSSRNATYISPVIEYRDHKMGRR